MTSAGKYPIVLCLPKIWGCLSTPGAPGGDGAEHDMKLRVRTA